MDTQERNIVTPFVSYPPPSPNCSLADRQSATAFYPLRLHQSLTSLTFDHIADDTPWSLHPLHNRINQKLEIGADDRQTRDKPPLTGDYISFPSYADLPRNRQGLVDLTFNWLEEDELIGNSTFDRAQVDWYGGKWEVTLGRQRINWGCTPSGTRTTGSSSQLPRLRLCRAPRL